MLLGSPITNDKMVVVYDGECPFCRNYAKLMSLRKAVGDVDWWMRELKHQSFGGSSSSVMI
jgi:predicted DCC family thiol-disulfide oxidoreductase YuxK